MDENSRPGPDTPQPPDYAERTRREAAQHQALVTLRHEGFYGATAVGAAAGMLKAWHAMLGLRAMVYDGVGGVVVIMIAGFLGGLLASVARGLLARSSHLESLDQEGDGEGPVIGGFGGAFLALVICLLAWDLPNSLVYVGIGTALGSFLGGLPGEHVGIIVRMLALQEHLERTGPPHPAPSTEPPPEDRPDRPK